MKWIIPSILAFFLTTMLTVTAFSEGTDIRLTGRVTVEELVGYAYQNNPRIRQVREAWRETVEQYRISTGYPDPELRFSYFPEPIETRLGPQDWIAGLNQKIPFPGKLSRAGKVIEAEARVSHIKLDRTVKEVMASVRRSFYELLYIRTAKRVIAENRRLLEHLRKVGETAYAKDRASLMDMVKAQSQLGQIRYDGILMAELEQTEKTRLNGILNRAHRTQRSGNFWKRNFNRWFSISKDFTDLPRPIRKTFAWPAPLWTAPMPGPSWPASKTFPISMWACRTQASASRTSPVRPRGFGQGCIRLPGGGDHSVVVRQEPGPDRPCRSGHSKGQGCRGSRP